MTNKEESAQITNPTPELTIACPIPRRRPAPPHHALVVINPVAGTSRVEQVRQEVTAVFTAHDSQFSFYETTGTDYLAEVIGHKPGSHSFPSGHTAAAFADSDSPTCHGLSQYHRWTTTSLRNSRIE